MSAETFYAELDVDLPERGGSWRRINCVDPDHEDVRGSCDVNVESGGFHCKACGSKGGAFDAAVARGLSRGDAAQLVKEHGLWRGDEDSNPARAHKVSGAQGGAGVGTPPESSATVQPPDLTVEAYAAAKVLPADFLRGLGISDYKDQRFPQRVLRIPYRDDQGLEPAVRIRKELDKRPDGTDERFLWRKGSKPCLYGLWRLAHGKGYGVVVEGESDCHVLWHHGIQAVGLPGAALWNEERDAPALDGIERIYVVIEPDTGGDAVLGWLGRSKIRDRAWLVELGEHGDPCGLHLADPEAFREHFKRALEAAEPWRVRAASLQTAESRDALKACRSLTEEPRILDVLERDVRRAGLAGEERLAKLVYLASTSRLLDRIVSVAVKGPSAAGKSYVVKRVLDFVPADACHALTAMSERALAFTEEPLEHRHLVIAEAAGMTGDWASYLIRSLLSEGHIRYEISEKDESGRMVTRVIDRPGPTGLIVTTTAISLHPENETRLISLVANDTAEQTSRVLLALAVEEADAVDFRAWHAIQRWLAGAERRVTIPYRVELARLVPPVAVRLRRDFGAVLVLIRAHALLHQATRARDEKGRIVATIDDYAVVRELVADLISDQAGATVRATTRETVAAVAELLEQEDGDHLTQAAVSRKLGLDKSAGQRRIAAALSDGYLRNLEDRKGRPSKLILGEPLPDEQPILPEPETVAGLQADQGVCRPPLPPGSNGAGPEFLDATPEEEALAERLLADRQDA